MDEPTFTKDGLDLLLVNKVEESTYLEFKGAGALHYDKSGNGLGQSENEMKDEIAKDVSAFANADGGVLIYGIKEKNHRASRYDFVDGDAFTKERLEQIIESRIHRSIIGLMIDPIRFEGNQTVYVVKIPRSLDTPHRSSDGRFYRRKNFSNDIMEEWEIRDSYYRTEKTNLEILPPKVTGGGGPARGEILIEYRVGITFGVQNVGRVIEEKYKLVVSS